MKKCLKCNKEFEASNVGSTNERKYCSRLCQTRFNAKKNYYKYRDTSDFKKKATDRMTKWRLENRDRFNALVRPKSREYQRKLRERLREEKTKHLNTLNNLN